MSEIKNLLKNLPASPGVYLFKNLGGEVLYVGKAKNLKNRVRSYFQKGQNHEPRIALMISQIQKIDYIIVSSELESLILENNLIKQYRSRFNVRMRDDKNYQFIKIDYATEIPQIYTVRRVAEEKKSRSKYFGPYTSGLSVKQTLQFINQVFGICRNKKITNKPCFAYHIGRCPGVCFGKISRARYLETFKQIEKLLNNKQNEILRDLKTQMDQSARSHQYEKAAIARNRIWALKNLWQKQKIISLKPLSQDYFSIYHKAAGPGVVSIFVVREGKIIHQENFEIESHGEQDETILLNSFLKQYYSLAANIPKEIVVPYKIPDQDLIATWLKVEIIIPRRGKKLELLKLAEQNAKNFYENKLSAQESVLESLKMLLDLPALPKRIEAYDISNIQGFLPVASMVVFEDGQPKKSDYRKFKIQGQAVSLTSLPKPDDFAMMKEVITRRFRHSETVSKIQNWPLPDLMIIDGGKGQLNAALSALRISNISAQGGSATGGKFQIPTIGLAKRLEEIFIPTRKYGIRLPANSPALHLLQRIRDEAHRFAITFYRGRHIKEQSRSRLDGIPGLGPKKKRRLLRKFGSLSAIRNASTEALAEELGISLAKKVKEEI